MKYSTAIAVLYFLCIILPEYSDDFTDFSHTFEMTSKAGSISEDVISKERSDK